eukprot:2192117-Pleurochrysis_carterae.AAC.3
MLQAWQNTLNFEAWLCCKSAAGPCGKPCGQPVCVCACVPGSQRTHAQLDDARRDHQQPRADEQPRQEEDDD